MSTKPDYSDISAGGRADGAPWSRSPVYGQNGMAATAHPLASRIAIDILKAGGSAVDGAIAANAALGLMEPTGCGIGGDLFAIVWDPASKKLHGLNASGRSPSGRTFEQMAENCGGKAIPIFGHLSVSVPGAVDGWFNLHEKFGNLPIQTLLVPAIDYAESGFPVTPIIAHTFDLCLKGFEAYASRIEEFENARTTYFKAGSPKKGSIFRNPDLARTYRQIADGGRSAFYEGEIARTMDAYMQRIGGDLRYEDFASHKSEWVEPRSVTYNGYDLFELPPNGQGFAALQMANILKKVDLTQWSRGSAKVLHFITETKRLAFEDLATYYTDPDFYDMPTDWLLSDAYGQERFALIDHGRANPSPSPGLPAAERRGDTTYLTVADKDGMMVSLIQSNFLGMGSGLVPDGLGFMFQNRGNLFSLDPDHPNCYAPGKRPFQTIIPAFLMKDGTPLMSFGVMGGSFQPQGHMQVLINLLDYGMNLQEAGDAARLFHEGGKQPTSVNQDPLGTLFVEPGIPHASLERLEKMGHNVKVIEEGVMFGGYQAIWRDPQTGVYTGATEMRKDGAAIGY